MNPLDMMKFSSLWSTFTANHPKFPKFIAAASRKGVLAEGSVIAMQITTPNGETLETNLKIPLPIWNWFSSSKKCARECLKIIVLYAKREIPPFLTKL